MALDELLDLLLPSRCPGCGTRGAPVCKTCARTMRAAPSMPPPPGVSWWAACFAYEGVTRELIARAKYRNERRVLRVFAPALATALARAPAHADVVTWAPASRARLHARGVDHAEVLARVVARLLGVPARGLVARSPGPAQTGLDARARRQGPQLRATAATSGLTVLVVDDVATTGGTCAAVARALRGAGAAEVLAVTAARTPPYTSESNQWSSSTRRAWTSSCSAST